MVTALAISRHIQATTGMSIRRFVRTLRPLRSATLNVNGHPIIIPPQIPDPSLQILNHLTTNGGH